MRISEEAKGGIAVHCKGEKWHNVSPKWLLKRYVMFPRVGLH